MATKPFKLRDYKQVTSIKGDMCLRRRSDGVVFYALTSLGDDGDPEAVGPICKLEIISRNTRKRRKKVNKCDTHK
jgi:hypothetical protein